MREVDLQAPSLFVISLLIFQTAPHRGKSRRESSAKNPESTRNEAPQKAPLPMCKQERSSPRGEELALLFVDRLDDGDF